MRTAEITELASPPVVAERDDPRPADGQLVLDVAAVALNPVDIAIAAGTFYAGHPPLAYIPAIEAAGWVGDRFVYAQGSGRGVATDGFLAERAVVTEADLVELPDGTDPALAAALGIAGATGWLATTARAAVGPDDIVVVLGATGAVGGIAVQAAKRCGARAVIAVGRDEARLAAVPGADARIAIGPTLAEEVSAVAGPPTVVIDMLWGEPLVSVLPVLAPRARVVNVGTSAGAVVPMPSAPIRGKQLDLLGYSGFGIPRAVFADGYRELVDLVVAGEIVMPVQRFGLTDVADAWRAAASGASKVVVEVAGCRPLMVEIVLPKLGMYEGDATLIEWLVDDGGAVAAGDPLFLVETDKIESEIEADDDGLLVQLQPPGFRAPIGTVIGYVVSTPEERDRLAT